ncbi:hypothetical protein F5X68DRAFT_262148 [Plectosphaerella plurivora]|uniref:Uncharacterized protein n=1 Tax=Plectosphaerella plurivora TaxID=936078 RepID=A0A9P8V905_9PEZI|nr:hypothetical protein F5X68DRAFT_262148 [Plectosphaerella plurivora]
MKIIALIVGLAFISPSMAGGPRDFKQEIFALNDTAKRATAGKPTVGRLVEYIDYDEDHGWASHSEVKNPVSTAVPQVEQGLAITGPDFPGGPNVTDFGSIKSVWEQVMKRNPNYNAWNNAEYVKEMAALNFTKENYNTALAKRDDDDGEPQGNFYPRVKTPRPSYDCSIGRNIEEFDRVCQESLMYLHRLGDKFCDVRSQDRAEMSCAWKCGIFLGTVGRKHTYVRCGKIANDAMAIAQRCGVKHGVNSKVWDAHGRIIYPDYYVDLLKMNC